MHQVREGRWDEVAPLIFSEDWPGPTVANLIDVQVRSFVASASGLPSINCSATSMVSERNRERADIRTKIANHYVTTSNLKAQMPMAVDAFVTYGLLAFSVEPCMDDQLPRIRVRDSQNVWPIWDQDMNTIAVARSYWVHEEALRTEYPAVALRLDNDRSYASNASTYEVIEYSDAKVTLTYVPLLDNLVIEEVPNPLGKCTWVCVPRYSGGTVFDGNFRGAYDDLVWPQLMRHQFQMLAMQAADDAINAPIAVPPDVQDVPVGPGAIVRTQNPQAVQRVRLDVPQAAFQSMEWLQQDMILGGMTTQQNLGSAGSGWTTGQGTDRLGEGYDGQVALSQVQYAFGITKAIALCFAWDEALWGKTSKKITGVEQGGAPYQLTYMAGRDINGDHTVDVRYGFLAGMDANRALVYILQAVAANLISKDFARRYLPEGVDAAQEEKKIRLEQMQDALSLAMQSLPQAIPQMVTAGADPSQLIMQYAGIITDLEAGESIQESIQKRFSPQPPPAALSPDAGQSSPAPGDSAAGSAPPGGQPPQVGVPQAGGGPLSPAGGGRPPIQELLAGLTGGGAPNLAAAVSRRPAAA